MASNNFQTTSIILCPLTFLIISHIPQSFSQPNSPQNIQTSYPFIPAQLILPPSPSSPPLPPPSPRKSSTWAAVGKAIGATAAATLVLTGLLFFLLSLYVRRKRNNNNATTTNTRIATGNLPQTENFTRFRGNLKGVIVDENGLDVLYWRNLHEEENGNNSFIKKQSYKTPKDDQIKRMVSDKERSKKPPLQEVPLLRGKSSSSQSPVWGQKQNQFIIQKPPSFPSRMPSIVELNQDSSAKHAPVLSCLQSGVAPRTKPEFDGDLMEAMFGYVAMKKKSPKKDGSTRHSQIFILDVPKSRNTGTMIKSLSVTHKEIINALEEGHGLNAETIEKLVSIAPSEEEASLILAFDGDYARLTDAELFLYHLLKAVPSAFARFKAMLSRSKYELEVSRIKENLESLESACKELRAPGLFPKLLDAVLKAGNRLGGHGHAFDIAALKKLSCVRSSDGRTSLLQFIVQEVVRAEGKRSVHNRERSRNGGQSSDHLMSREDMEREFMSLGLPVISGLSAEFPNVKKVAALDYDVLAKTGSMLAARVEEIRKTLEQGGPDGLFAQAMKGFLDTAELEIKTLMEEQVRVVELAKKTTDCYPSGSLKRNQDKDDPLRVFEIMRDFLQMVDQVCADITMDVEMRRPAAASVAGPFPERTRVFRFPKLPADFLSRDSSE